MLDSPPSTGAVGVMRSRTLPSRKKGGGDDVLGLGMESSGGGGGARRERGTEKRVLKKQRRVSGGGVVSPAMGATPNLNTSTAVNRTWG